jgi:hypothetical protein
MLSQHSYATPKESTLQRAEGQVPMVGGGTSSVSFLRRASDGTYVMKYQKQTTMGVVPFLSSKLVSTRQIACGHIELATFGMLVHSLRVMQGAASLTRENA